MRQSAVRNERPALISTDLWPPNGVDLSLFGYKMDRNAAAVYEVYDVDILKQQLIDIRHSLEHSVIDGYCTFDLR